jgi:ectoine hydroxylase-related dioxygenase (phytanoyl-CoA dioxygenase family)
MLSVQVDASRMSSSADVEEYQAPCKVTDRSFELIYTEKEKALHIHGPKSILPSFKRFYPHPEDIPLCDLKTFFHHGYVVPNLAVDTDLIYKAREYIDHNYRRWVSISKRQDDWRIHYQVNLNENELIDHEPIMNLMLKSDHVLKYLTTLMGANPVGIFYTQIALRTPTKKASKSSETYQEGAEYHLDGNANIYGIRFPDPWTVMVGVALVDISSDEMGNFTVFPGWHQARDWSYYPIEKQSKSLPNLGEPTKIILKAGDVVIVHVLLPHRGGRNTLDGSSSIRIDDGDAYVAKNIPSNTREMVFFRFRGEGIVYESNDRCQAILHDPWCEFPIIKELVIHVEDEN